MKHLLAIFLAIVLCIGLISTVSAQSAGEQLRSDTIIDSHGNAVVNLTVTLNMEEAVADPVFPIPADAGEITLNGGEQKPTVTGQGALISLRSVTGGMAGQFTFTVRYTLPSVVASQTDEEGKETLTLTLPLLSGFAYPVERLEFSVTLPGEVPQAPTFSSSYYQQNIHSLMQFQSSGSTVTGTASNLKDHETLTMTLPVNDSLFPQTAVEVRVMGMMDIAVVVFALLATGYYLLTLMPKIRRRKSYTTAPDGITAGETALWLTGRGVDLSLLVVSWAQLGYLRLQVDDNGRVLLHKRMDMGNERSTFENRCFKSLFGRRTIVDGTGYHYAQLCRDLRRKTPGIKDIFRPRSGNPGIFRFLGLIAAALSGILLGQGFHPHSIFLRVLFSMLCIGFAFALQSGGNALPVRQKLPLYIGLPCGFVWLVLGIAGGEIAMTVFMVAFQFLCGIAAAYGGKRTELGNQVMGQFLGLRKHMYGVSKKELQRLLKGNPEYFHDLVPYALALDCDRRFARRFARLRLPECTYLISGTNHQMTAGEWAKLLRTTVQTLDAKANRLPFEKLTGK